MAQCFLCEPDAALVYAANASAFALCGLGPLVNGYSIVGTRAHIPSCADAALKNGELVPFTESIRKTLADRYGSCLLTEHGRLPVCVPPVAAEDHCFHAHFLLFPGAPDITQNARAYFAQVIMAPMLDNALAVAREQGEYFLLSPTASSFFVMTRPGKLIRQFARLLVAEAVGNPGQANWARHPERKRAAADAADLREIVPS